MSKGPESAREIEGGARGVIEEVEEEEEVGLTLE